jgi:hypothetical protein
MYPFTARNSGVRRGKIHITSVRSLQNSSWMLSGSTENRTIILLIRSHPWIQQNNQTDNIHFYKPFYSGRTVRMVNTCWMQRRYGALRFYFSSLIVPESKWCCWLSFMQFLLDLPYVHLVETIRLQQQVEYKNGTSLPG